MDYDAQPVWLDKGARHAWWKVNVNTMKNFLVLIAPLALALLAIPASSQTKAPQKPASVKKVAVAPKPAAPTVKPLVIPKDATPNADGTYSWADKAGKKWIFAKTPFGISRIEDVASFASALAVGQFVKAFEVGAKIRFERQTPFDTKKWEKNKADLTDDERAIVAAQTPQTSGDKKPE